VAEGDYVLISHTDIADGDTSQAYIGRLLQLYEAGEVWEHWLKHGWD